MIIIISVIAFYLSFRLFKVAAGTMDLTKINMISSMYYANILIPYFLSSIFIYYNLDNHYLINKIDDNSNSLKIAYYVLIYTIIALPLGMILANIIFKVNPKVFYLEFINRPITFLNSPKDAHHKFFLNLSVLVCFIAIAYVFLTIGSIPFLNISGMTTNELLFIRKEVGRGFTGIALIKDLFALILTPILTYTFYINYKISNNKKQLIMFIIMFMTCVLTLTYNFAKAPLIIFLINFLFLKVLIDGQVPKKIFIFGGLFICGLIIVNYLLLTKLSIDQLTGFTNGPMGRVFFTQSAGFYLTFDAFPKYHDFIGLESMSDFFSSNILGTEKLARSGEQLQSIYNKSAYKAGLTGTINSLFVAEAYANFGFFGVLFAPIYVGFLTQFFFIKLFSQKKIPIIIAIITFFSFRSLINGGFNDYLYNPLYVSLITVIAILLFLSKKFRFNS